MLRTTTRAVQRIPPGGVKADLPQGLGHRAAEGVEVRHQDVEEQEDGISLHQPDGGQERVEEDEHPFARQDGGHPGGKDAGFVRPAVEAEAEGGVYDADRGQGDQEVPGLDNQVGDAVLGVREDAGVKGDQQEGQDFRPEGADRKEEGIGQQPPVSAQGLHLLVRYTVVTDFRLLL